MKSIPTSKAILLCGLLTVLSACSTTPATKVSRSEAEKIALAAVPNGKVQEGELEKEHGKWVWSFDITTLGSGNITEIHVDAMTSEILAWEKESPAHERSEKTPKAK